MAIEIGDMVVANGRAGEVVGLDGVTGGTIIRAFSQPGQEQLEPGPPFTAEGEVQLLKKHWEWGSAGVRQAEVAWQQWAARQDRIAREHANGQAVIQHDWDQKKQWER